MSAFDEYIDLSFDRTTIPQAELDLEGARRVNALPWRGQFSPKFVETMLGTYSPSGTVLDPFCGSGTALMESAHLGLESHGVEVNPSAYMLSRLYELCELSPRTRIALLEEALSLIEPETISGAEELGAFIRSIAEVHHQSILQATFLLALGNGDALVEKKWNKAIDQVRALVTRLPETPVKTTVSLGDARATALAADSVDTVFTSPPYVNVFNYHQNYRKAVEMLGWEVLPSARSEFGSNRKHRMNRFLTVTQYAQDIGQTLAESLRVVRPGGTSIWVVGRESAVRGTRVLNPQIVYSMAVESVGLELVTKHERKFRSRYGALVYEDILVFRHPERGGSLVDPVTHGREVGIAALRGMASDDPVVTGEINEAILKSANILPSPIAEASPLIVQ